MDKINDILIKYRKFLIFQRNIECISHISICAEIYEKISINIGDVSINIIDISIKYRKYRTYQRYCYININLAVTNKMM